LSFDDLQKAAKVLEEDFNSKLVSLLNSCDEPIVLGVDPSFWRRNTFDECWHHPVTINIGLKKDVPSTTTPVYSASSTQTII
jgi:hypothetical protein